MFLVAMCFMFLSFLETSPKKNSFSSLDGCFAMGFYGFLVLVDNLSCPSWFVRTTVEVLLCFCSSLQPLKQSLGSTSHLHVT